jgi:hypothetical protein
MPKQKTGFDYGVLTYYVTFVIFFFIEASIVHFFGFWPSMVIFIVGGAILGLVVMRMTKPEDTFRDPLLKAGVWFYEKLGYIGYVFYAVSFGAPTGIGAVMKKLDHPRKLSLTLISAVLFAVVWVPLFHYVWK